MGKKMVHEAGFKCKVALEAIRAELTIAEIATKYQIHGSMVSKWKAQVLDEMPGIFTGAVKSVKNLQEVETKRLYEQIGKLQMTVDFLKNAVYPR
jgi:transposase-like protein